MLTYDLKNIYHMDMINNYKCPYGEEFDESLRKNTTCPKSCTCLWTLYLSCKGPLIIENLLPSWRIVSLHRIEIHNNLFSTFFYNTISLEIVNSSLESLPLLQKFPNLVKLNITLNKIKFLEKAAINLKNLQIFVLVSNDGLIAIEQKDNTFPNTLITLSLTFSIIEKISYDNLKNLKNLINLNLTSSVIHKFQFEIFQTFSKLEILDIKNIEIPKEQKLNSRVNFKYLTSLKYLYSSDYKYCCHLTGQNLTICEPKRKEDTSSCEQMITQTILKGFPFNSAIFFNDNE